MIVSPNDICNAHLAIVHHHGEVIGKAAIRALQYEVIQFFHIYGDNPFHQILEGDRAAQGTLEPHHCPGRFSEVKLPALAIIFGF